MEMLDHYGIDPKGKKVTVIGRSMVVGKPLAMLLLKRHATVTICHTRTEDLTGTCRAADILIAAAGKAKMVTAPWQGKALWWWTWASIWTRREICAGMWTLRRWSQGPPLSVLSPGAWGASPHPCWHSTWSGRQNP